MAEEREYYLPRVPSPEREERNRRIWAEVAERLDRQQALTEPVTPFDHPVKLWERLLFPLAREIWIDGYRGRDDG